MSMSPLLREVMILVSFQDYGHQYLELKEKCLALNLVEQGLSTRTVATCIAKNRHIQDALFQEKRKKFFGR